VAAAIVTTLAVTVPAAEAEAGRLDPGQVSGSIAYLRQAYGVSEQEALRRLDQADGGRLVVATSPQTVAGHLSGLPDRGHIVVKRVSRSLAELRATRDRLAAEVGDGPDSVVLPRVSETTNQVVAWRRDWLVTDGTRTRAVQSMTALDRAAAGSSRARCPGPTSSPPRPTSPAASRCTA
jgi:streptogrisin C